MQVPAECKNNEHKQGTGVTIYHFVESIDVVSSLRSTSTEHGLSFAD